jgi:hypothetical protein
MIVYFGQLIESFKSSPYIFPGYFSRGYAVIFAKNWSCHILGDFSQTHLVTLSAVDELSAR